MVGVVLLLHQGLLVWHHIFLLTGAGLFHLLHTLLIIGRSRLAKYVFLFHHVHSIALHLLAWYCACCCYMVFRSSCDYSPRYLFLIFEWNLLSLRNWFIVVSHISWNWLVTFELNIFVLLSSWGGLPTA